MGKARILSLAAVTLAATITSGVAAGDFDSPILSMSVLRNGAPAWSDQALPTQALGGGNFEYGSLGQQIDYVDAAGWAISYNVSYASGATSGSGPVIATLTFGLTNNTGSEDSFTVNTTLPLLAALGPAYNMGGSVEGTLGDADFSGGGLLSDNGGPIYSGLVDGTSRLSLLNDPFSFGGVAFGTAPFGPDSAGLPGVSLPGVGANPFGDIGIDIDFRLSDGDSATFTADFVVQAVPAPGALALLGLGLVAPRRRRR